MSVSPAVLSSLTFPHPLLTPLEGTPTNTSLQGLQKQLYANARAIHSTRGGGANGHLALVMPTIKYNARTYNPFIAPIHPGDAPLHLPAATSAQITETNRQFNQDLAEHTRYNTVAEELKKKILLAVPTRYLSILEDTDFGFAVVSSNEMLAHLKATYGIITNEEIESNRTQLATEWNPDEPIEDLWLRIQEMQRFATAANEPITDAAALRLTLIVFEKTGVFTTATEKWRDRAKVDWTMTNFKAHFNKANKERIRKLTAQTGGYHGTHHIAPVEATVANFAITPSPATTNAAAPSVHTNDSVNMFYCWTHVLSKSRNHTGATCNHKATGHKDTATADNMQGGSDRIVDRTRQQSRHPAKNG
jgi:hypothetical protein